MPRRHAAALLITRGSGEGIEIFLAERARQLRFFGGYWALPGGTIDPEDGDDEPTAMQACARRELFEETGLLWQRLSTDRTREELVALRTAMTSRDAKSSEHAPLPLTGEPMRELCRIETPAFAPVRYDTVFFHVPLEECEAGSSDEVLPEVWDGELTEGHFMRPTEALMAWRRGEIFLVPPVVIVLEHVEAALGDTSAFAQALPMSNSPIKVAFFIL